MKMQRKTPGFDVGPLIEPPPDRSDYWVFALFIVALLAIGVTAGFVNQYHNAKAHRPCLEAPDAE